MTVITHVKVAAVVLKGGVAQHLHQAVGHGHDKAGGAQGEDPTYSRRLEPQGVPPQPEERPPSSEELQHPQGGTALGEHRGQGRPPHPHIQGKDEDGIQHDVHRRPQGHRHHPHAAEALGVDKGVHAQADHHKEGAQQIDGQVVVGVGEGQVAGPKEIEDGPPEGQAEHRQSPAKQEQEGKGVA